MFKNYLKMTLRNLKKHKGYSFLNIAGLSVGLAANILAWPIDFLAMDRWLRGFAYRIGLFSQIGWFILAAVLSMAIALITVSFQTIKAALADPVRSLRYE